MAALWFVPNGADSHRACLGMFIFALDKLKTSIYNLSGENLCFFVKSLYYSFIFTLHYQLNTEKFSNYTTKTAREAIELSTLLARERLKLQNLFLLWKHHNIFSISNIRMLHQEYSLSNHQCLSVGGWTTDRFQWHMKIMRSLLLLFLSLDVHSI